MSTVIRKHTAEKKVIRFKRKKRIRSKIFGTREKPRFAVFKSNAHLYAQLIDDETGNTLLSVSTLEGSNRATLKNNRDGAKSLGLLLAQRAKEKKLNEVVFDRSGYIYHGKIKSIADAAREGGLKF
jgi:large subunit ribosomal protein L18